MSLDLLIVGAFVAYSVSVGLANRRRSSRSLEEYLLAGRDLPGWQAGFSMAATQYAADTPLLVTGLVATAGVFSLWRLWIYALAFLLMGFVLGASWRRSGVLTDAELTELRYGGRAAAWLRLFKALHLGTVVNCTVLAMVLTASARIVEPFLTWHLWLPAPPLQALAGLLERAGLLLTSLPASHPDAWLLSAGNFISVSLIIAFILLYSATGGLRSVVATDVVQFSLAMAATALYAVFILQAAGGLGGALSRLESLYGEARTRAILSFGPGTWDQAAFLACAVIAVQWFAQVNADGTGYLAQRTMACRSDHDTRVAGVTFTFGQVLFRSLLWLPIAVGLLALYPAENLPALGAATEAFRVEREASFAVGIRDLLPAGARGLMLTGLLAALASTVDTHLNWGASYWANDLYKRFLMEGLLKRRPQARELVWVARLSTLGILLLALWIATRLRSIQAAWHLSLLFGSGLGSVLILRWIWYRINVYSEMTAVAASLLLSPILLLGFPGLEEGARLLWMTVLSTGAVIAVTLLTPPEPEPALLRFYTRARPSGFWGPVLRRLGEEPSRSRRRLARGLAATGLAAASCLLLLTGIASGMLHVPLGASPLGPLLLAGLGLALIPLWLRLGFS